jgi:hypothetical protein
MHIVGKSWISMLLLSLVLGGLGCSAEGGATAAVGGSAGVGGSSATSGGYKSNDNVGGTAGNGGNVSSDYQPVSVTNSGLQYTLQMGPIRMVIDGGKGARVTEFSFNGSNVLTGSDVNQTNYGSTFWPSPQSSWYVGKTWPPIPAIDTAEYTGAIDGNSVELTSPVATLGAAANSQFTVTKQFKAVPESGAIDVTYTISNTSSSVSLTVAPWEISRVKGVGGLTFFGKGSDTPRLATTTDTANFVVTEAGGIYWYKCATLAASASKCFADGAGWLAHVTADNILFLLTYPDIQPSEAAEGEAEVEFYNKKADGDYVELEPQGALSSLAPGASVKWTVRWKLRQVPSGTTVDIGSPDLASFTAQQKNQ